MKLAGKVAVVTGGGNGIGQAMCRAFAAQGARGVVVADLEADAAQRTAQEIGGVAFACDVSREADVQALIEHARASYGEIDLFCSNAGLAVGGGLETSDADWKRVMDVNLTAHVHAARALVPQMLERGEGYLLQTVSAAGLLSVSDPSYVVAKHAALAFAEWLSITYGDHGIRVSCFCPQGVRTRMLLGSSGGADLPVLLEGSVSPEEAAQAVVDGLDAERFLILTHPEVRDYVRRKAEDPDRWLRGMRRFQGTGKKDA